jgi:AraC-like DNA-binding protein
MKRHSIGKRRLPRRKPFESLDPWVRTREPLLWLEWAGHERHRPGEAYFHDCRKRPDKPHVVLQFTLSGAGHYQRGAKAVLVKKGMAFLDIIPGVFSYGSPPGMLEPYENVFVSFQGEIARSWYAGVVRSYGHVLNLIGSSHIQSQMQEIALHAERARENVPWDRYLLSGKLYQLLMTVSVSLHHSHVRSSPLVMRAMELIDARAGDGNFNVSRLADELRCARESISRGFQACLKVTPIEYIAQRRTRIAASLLRTTDLKLHEVAARSGFGNAAYLCRIFRKRLGITPAQLRNNPGMVI